MTEQPAVPELNDPLLPAQRIYAMAVVAAEREYRRVCARAWQERQAKINEALEACELALQTERAS